MLPSDLWQKYPDSYDAMHVVVGVVPSLTARPAQATHGQRASALQAVQLADGMNLCLPQLLIAHPAQATHDPQSPALRAVRQEDVG